MKNLYRNRKGISPVIATVILVAVAITVSIAVAYWMGGIASLYTRFEKLEISNIYAQTSSGDYNWTIVMTVRNTGSADATIDDILLQGLSFSTLNTTGPIQYKVDSGNYGNGTISISIPSGGSKTIYIQFSADCFTNSLSAGTTIEVKLHSVSGQNYPKMVQLP